jgi:hypothetical protein
MAVVAVPNINAIQKRKKLFMVYIDRRGDSSLLGGGGEDFGVFAGFGADGGDRKFI